MKRTVPKVVSPETCSSSRAILILWISLCLGLGNLLAVRAEEIGPLEHIVLRESPLLDATYCQPLGPGPFPLVIYNHGGLGRAVGGPIEDTCRALARAGFVGYAPRRRKTVSLAGHLDDVLVGLEHASGLEKVDATRIAMVGFSRGGLLTYQVAIRTPHLRAAVILAPAHGRGALESSLKQAHRVQSPVLILISKNDNTKTDLVTLSSRLEHALRQADRNVRRIVYPPFAHDGHRRFFSIGSYWTDVQSFLHQHLGPTTNRTR